MGVREIATQAMQANGLRQYATQAEPVIAAIEAEEQALVARLIEAGTGLGADEEAVKQALRDAGLTVAETTAGDAALAAKVTRLEDFARRHGFTG